MRQAVIIAGGLGSRLSSQGITVPKSLLEVNGCTLIEHQLKELQVSAIEEVLVILGHGSETILRFLDQIKHRYSFQINTFVESNRSGTFGALQQAYRNLDDYFLVVLGDLFIQNCGFGHIANSLGGNVVFVKFTDHPVDSDLISIDDFSMVKQVSSYPHKSDDFLAPFGISGVFILEKKNLLLGFSNKAQDISKHFLSILLDHEVPLRAVFHQGTIRDLGTRERLEEFQLNPPLPMVKVRERKSLHILIDRDGTLNELNGHIVEGVDLAPSIWAPVISSFIRNNSFTWSVVTNQPVISHGLVTFDEILSFTEHFLSKELGLSVNQGQVFICPHYPEAGFPDEIEDLKIICGCRKPNPNLLLRAMEQNGVYASDCLMIGDTVYDVMAGLRIGASIIHLHNYSIHCQFSAHPRVECIGDGEPKTLERVLLSSLNVHRKESTTS